MISSSVIFEVVTKRNTQARNSRRVGGAYAFSTYKSGRGCGGQYYVFVPNLEKAEFLVYKKKFSINLRRKRVVLKQKDNLFAYQS
jgi:hypothetical protein